MDQPGDREMPPAIGWETPNPVGLDA